MPQPAETDLRGRAVPQVATARLIELMREAGHHAPERIGTMLAGEIRPRDAWEIGRRIAVWGCRVSMDTITIALLADKRIDHAVLAHAASLRGAVYLRDAEGSLIASMIPSGQAEIVLGVRPAVLWVSGFDAAGDMYRHPDLDPGQGVFAVEPVPDSMIPGMEGRPLRGIISHRALNAAALKVAKAVQGEFHTLIQPCGHHAVSMRDLLAHMPHDALHPPPGAAWDMTG